MDIAVQVWLWLFVDIDASDSNTDIHANVVYNNSFSPTYNDNGTIKGFTPQYDVDQSNQSVDFGIADLDQSGLIAQIVLEVFLDWQFFYDFLEDMFDFNSLLGNKINPKIVDIMTADFMIDLVNGVKLQNETFLQANYHQNSGPLPDYTDYIDDAESLPYPNLYNRQKQNS
jgi:hypothetical protein